MSGRVNANQPVKSLSREGNPLEQTRVTKILAFRGLEQESLETAEAGDIVTIAGFSKATVADTLCDETVSASLPAQPIDPPTLAMTFSVTTRHSRVRKAPRSPPA